MIRESFMDPVSESSSLRITPSLLCFKKLFAFSPGLCWIVRPDPPHYSILTANDACLKTLKVVHNDIVGRSLFDFLPENSSYAKSTWMAKLRISLDRVRQNKVIDHLKVQKFYVRRPKEQGGNLEERFWSAMNIPVFDEKDLLSAILYHMEDVTEFISFKNVDESDLEKNETRALSVNTSKALVLIMAQDEEVNRSLCETLGKDFQIVSVKDGREGVDKVALLHPDLVITDEGLPGMSESEMIQLIRAQHGPGHGQIPIITLKEKVDKELCFKLQNQMIQDYLLKPFESEELLARIKNHLAIKFMHEALEKSEEKFRDLMESAYESIILVNAEGRIEIVNKKVTECFGYEPLELLGQPIEMLIPERYRTSHLMKRTHYLEHPVARPMGKDLSLWARRKDGSEFPVDISLKPLQTEKGLRVSAVIYDITEKKQAQEQLFHSAKLASLGTLTAGVAHEINNPLAIIVGNLEILSEKNAEIGEEQVKRLDRINKACFRIKAIVDKMRIFSRADTNSNDELFDVNQSIVDTLSLLETLYGKVNIALVKHLVPMKLLVKGNLGNFQQVLLNLLLNAKDAMPSGGTLAIRTSIHGDQQRVDITDTGVGVLPEHLNKIFSPFFTTKEPGKGTGLGLSISFAMIQQMGGMITVSSLIGKGTTFTITLPLSQEGATENTVKQAPPLEQFKGKILVVDDEEDICDLLSYHLRLWGFEVDTAANGLEAFNKVKLKDYQIIITDLKMPKMDGKELILEIHKLPQKKEVKIIMNTGHVADENKELLADVFALCDGLLYKPFSSHALYDLIEEVGIRHVVGN
ncbi:MAG: response regulator [Oligoflexia bacterium]|nr:response regulator [Oligoflexia bacterium]